MDGLLGLSEMAVMMEEDPNSLQSGAKAAAAPAAEEAFNPAGATRARKPRGRSSAAAPPTPQVAVTAVRTHSVA